MFFEEGRKEGRGERVAARPGKSIGRANKLDVCRVCVCVDDDSRVGIFVPGCFGFFTREALFL